MVRKDNHLTGNIGLYYVCYQLSRLGWNVMPTARNARGIDIVAYNNDGKRMISVQVKALSKRSAVPLGNSLDKVIGDYWVIVNKVASDKPEAFILLPPEVKTLSAKDSAYWLNPKDYDKPEFKEAWHRIDDIAVMEDREGMAYEMDT